MMKGKRLASCSKKNKDICTRVFIKRARITSSWEWSGETNNKPKQKPKGQQNKWTPVSQIQMKWLPEKYKKRIEKLNWIGLELSCLVIKIFDHSASRYQLHPMLQLTTKQRPNHSDQNWPKQIKEAILESYT